MCPLTTKCQEARRPIYEARCRAAYPAPRLLGERGIELAATELFACLAESQPPAWLNRSHLPPPSQRLTQVGHRQGLIAFVLVKSQAFPALLVLGHDDPGAWLT